MSEDLINLVFSLTTEDSSSIGNGARMALLREQLPDLTDDYQAARDLLDNDGLAGQGDRSIGSLNRLQMPTAKNRPQMRWS